MTQGMWHNINDLILTKQKYNYAVECGSLDAHIIISYLIYVSNCYNDVL